MLILILVAPALPPTVAAPRAADSVYPGHPRLNIGGYGHVNDLAMDYLLHDDTGAADSAVSHLQNDILNCSYERSNAGGYAFRGNALEAYAYVDGAWSEGIS